MPSANSAWFVKVPKGRAIVPTGTMEMVETISLSSVPSLQVSKNVPVAQANVLVTLTKTYWPGKKMCWSSLDML
jgi:hypothetical protein